MKYPFVSVAVVAYNSEKYIEECLQSLNDLNYPKNKYEILLIDGGSSDKTAQIARKFKKVKVFNNPKRIISAGRNIAIEKSKGEYLAFTDSDCKADKNWLRELVKEILSSDDDIAGVGGPNLIFDNDPKFARIVGYMQETFFGSGGSPTSYRFKEKKKFPSVGNANLLLKKDLIKNYLYDEELNVGEDCDFTFRLNKKGFSFIYSPSVIVWHHRRNSLKSFIKNMFLYGEAQAKILKKHKTLARKYSVLPSIMVLALLISPFLIYYTSLFFYLYLVLGEIYFILLLISSFYVINKEGISGILTLVLLPIQHLSYGFGFYWGLLT